MDSEDGARATARRWPRMGRYIAGLRLSEQEPVTYEKTGITGHYTLWADPATLLARVVSVVKV